MLQSWEHGAVNDHLSLHVISCQNVSYCSQGRADHELIRMPARRTGEGHTPLFHLPRTTDSAHSLTSAAPLVSSQCPNRPHAESCNWAHPRERRRSSNCRKGCQDLVSRAAATTLPGRATPKHQAHIHQSTQEATLFTYRNTCLSAGIVTMFTSMVIKGIKVGMLVPANTASC